MPRNYTCSLWRAANAIPSVALILLLLFLLYDRLASPWIMAYQIKSVGAQVSYGNKRGYVIEMGSTVPHSELRRVLQGAFALSSQSHVRIELNGFKLEEGDCDIMKPYRMSFTFTINRSMYSAVDIVMIEECLSQINQNSSIPAVMSDDRGE